MLICVFQNIIKTDIECMIRIEVTPTPEDSRFFLSCFLECHKYYQSWLSSGTEKQTTWG